MDFVIGRLAYWSLAVPVKFLIKKEAFQHPLGFLVKNMGGIPVDRKKSTNLVDQVADLFKDYEVLNVIITPEGTRKLVTNWKKGFYYIAIRANVPIVMGFGDFESGFKQIEDFYRTKSARFPKMFSLSPENNL
jgi:1-acyl-sn-glycerol-3-phosphate acyltransferase